MTLCGRTLDSPDKVVNSQTQSQSLIAASLMKDTLNNFRNSD